MRRNRDGEGGETPSSGGRRRRRSRRLSGREEEDSASPERSAVWHSPERDRRRPAESSAEKLKGFVRSWQQRRSSDRDKAKNVVDLLRCFTGEHEGGAEEGQQEENLSDNQAQLLQTFVNSLQSFSAGIASPNMSPAKGEQVVEFPSSSLSSTVAGVVVGVSPAKKREMYVSMVAKEMEEIMALHEAGLLDLDDDPTIVSHNNAEETTTLAASVVSQKQTVIDEEVLALNALMASGWWDGPASSVKRRSRQHRPPQMNLEEEGEEETLHPLPPSSFAPKFPSVASANPYFRVMVLELGFSSYKDGGGASRPQLVLRTVLAESDALRILLLRDEWIVQQETPIGVGDWIHFVGSFDGENVAVVDREQNYVVVHPDRLVRVTSIGDAVACLRRSVLSEKLKIYSDAAEMVIGSLIHSLFEVCVLNNDFSDDFCRRQSDVLIPTFIERLYGVGRTENEARRRILEAMPLLRGWASRFLSPGEKSQTTANFDENPKTSLRITKVLEIEQQIWCPMWGITGKIDMVLQARVGDTSVAGKEFVVPLELKTGPTTTDRMGQRSHRAQVILYTVLLEQIYGCEVEMGLLYYSANSAVIGVRRNRSLLVALIQQRNAIAHHLSHPKMPQLKRDPFICNSCAQVSVCMLVHRSQEQGNAASSGVPQKFVETTQHLNERDLAFFNKWDTINRTEASGGDASRAEIWTMESERREEAGRCLARMSIAKEGISSSRTRIGSDSIVFERSILTSNASNSLKSQARRMIAVGDHVVMSSEEGHVGVMTGFVVALSDTTVTVDIRGPFALPPLRDDESGQKNNGVSFHGLVDIEDLATGKTVLRDKRVFASNIVWRIDADSLATQVGIHNRSLVWLMKPENARPRSLVIDLREPSFRVSTALAAAPMLDSSALSPMSQPENGREEELWKRMHAALNVYQLRAIESALNAKDYSLVLGVPGSGKTSTMAWMIAVLTMRKQSVMVTGFTHASVDALLLKLRELEIGFVRLAPGAESVHPDIRPFVSANRAHSVAELKSMLETPLVVGATCLQVKHPLFSKRLFDVCIVDEATQITVSAVLGPLQCAKRFVLVGDHYQLPPFVQSLQARDMGMGESLFHILSRTHPSAVSMLEYQYRMNADIMSLCNSLVYNHRLRCGNESVARSMLSLHSLSSIESFWLREVCDPTRRVVFVDTDAAALGEDEGGRGVNEGEARVVGEVVAALTATCGVSPKNVGVISPYRAQVALIEEVLASMRVCAEVNTIDRCQGRDWDVILMSMVRSNNGRLVGELLTDWRRLNVAISRARCKLVIVGDRATLKNIHMLSEMLVLMERNKWVVNLPSTYNKK